MKTLTKTFTGAKIITETLKSLGVECIFGYPGAVVLGIYDELSKQKDITHYLVRHEQSAIHSAEGYAKVSGKCGVVLVTSGPGATNIVTGLANAYLDGTPIVAITGQVSKELLHKNAFQEVDIINITKPCTKKNFQVTDIKDLQSTLCEAFKTAMSGRKGPVLVDISKNVFSQEGEFNNSISQNSNIEISKQIDYTALNNAAEMLKSAHRPVIIAGAGASFNEIKILSGMLNIPVVKTMMGFYPADDKNYIGMVGIFGHESANHIVRESDLIFAIGTRLNDRVTCNFGDNYKKLIHLDINEKEISKNIEASIGLVGDSKIILKNIISRLKKSDNTDWLEYAQNSLRLNFLPQKRSNHLHSFEIIEEIQKYFDKNMPVITTEVGQHQVFSAKYLKFYEPNKFITSGGLGTMGFGFPAAIGASIALNKTPVICIAGDGSAQMNIHEIATCQDYEIPVKLFIFNNGYLGMVRQSQEKLCDKRYFATKISNPDFVKLAQSYGAKGIRVTRKDEVKNAIEQAFSYKGFVIAEFLIEAEELLWF